MSDYYVLLVISREPFDKSAVEILKRQEEVRHFIQTEVDVETRAGCIIIKKSAPEYMIENWDKILLGKGKCASETIADWLKNLCRSMRYIPEYKKKEENNMYCPRCGGDKFEQLWGNCSKQCIYCEKAIYCSQPWDKNEIDPETLPIFSKKEALKLRKEYDKFPGNKEKGEKHLKENKKFWDKVHKDSLDLM